MKRIAWTVRLLVAIPLFAVGVARGQDEVRYFDRTKKAEVTVTGTIQEESPGRIVIKSATAGGGREIPAGDVIDVVYQVRPALTLDYRRARTKEAALEKAEEAKRVDALKEALKEYTDFAGKVADVKPLARHIDYKITRLKLLLAAEDPNQADAALSALADFKKKHPGGWQIVHVSRLLASLQEEKGDYLEAAATFDELAKTPGISREIQQECELRAAQALTRAKRFKEAETRLRNSLRSLSATDPQATRVQIFLAQCQAGNGQLQEAVNDLTAIIDKVSDPQLKAMAYNTLGDCYLLAGRSKDALWSYLWVDVIYHQDKTEHARAMAQLAKLFEERQDEARAKEYRERLAKTK
ncbi:MAG: tetratricopeptide repeat protein [Gemmataceae bacterium]|nr:tetratricopeptide repeat protein [Gemmataceae bacterium]MDW8264019.1 tetratricopeptide repeat protein [Gemmataceae bacterium]